jgi:hypothetical protein
MPIAITVSVLAGLYGAPKIIERLKNKASDADGES